MTKQKFEIGQEVVRTKGDYVVGRIGIIINIEGERAQVTWGKGNGNSKVAFASLELTSIPYLIIAHTSTSNPKYVRL